MYIGKTYRDVIYRWANGLGYHPGSSVRTAIDKYGWENVEKEILYEKLTYEEACQLETEEITRHGGINHPLVLNNQSGGDVGFVHSDSIKQKKSEILKKMHKEHPEIWDPMVEARRIKVDQYSYDGTTFIATYNSIIEAAKSIGISENHISQVMKGTRLSAGGFRWIEHGKHFGIIQFNDNPRKFSIEQLDKDTGEVIAKYYSIAEASKMTGICGANIGNCVHHRRDLAGGFRWRKCELNYT